MYKNEWSSVVRQLRGRGGMGEGKRGKRGIGEKRREEGKGRWSGERKIVNDIGENIIH